MTTTITTEISLEKFAEGKEDMLAELIEESVFGFGADIGICISCGERRSETEPDASEYECPFCGRDTVFGIEEFVHYI